MAVHMGTYVSVDVSMLQAHTWPRAFNNFVCVHVGRCASMCPRVCAFVIGSLIIYLSECADACVYLCVSLGFSDKSGMHVHLFICVSVYLDVCENSRRFLAVSLFYRNCFLQN